jgi:hypothetical protein
VNDERRLALERFFDGEADADDPRVAADGPEARDYLRRLGLLRDLARRHDPAADLPSRRPVVVPPRPRGRIVATALALAAGVLFLFLSFAARSGLRTGREPASLPAGGPQPTASAGVAVAATARSRSPRPPLEVELYRWANASSPHREEAARVVLSRVASLHGRPASREILALELANATPGSFVKLPRSVAPQAAATPGSIRRPGPSRRHRPSPSPKA